MKRHQNKHIRNMESAGCDKITRAPELFQSKVNSVARSANAQGFGGRNGQYPKGDRMPLTKNASGCTCHNTRGGKPACDHNRSWKTLRHLLLTVPSRMGIFPTIGRRGIQPAGPMATMKRLHRGSPR